MKVTLSAIKADVGSIGGHTRPSDKMMEIVKERLAAEKGRLLIDFYIDYTGDDIRLIMSPKGIFGAFRLQSSGGEKQEMRSPAETRERMDLYRKEMADFTAFLIKKFLHQT